MANSRNRRGTVAMAGTAEGETNGAMRIDPALVRELAHLLTENALTEIEVEDGDRKIKVKREPAALQRPGHGARRQSAVRPRGAP